MEEVVLEAYGGRRTQVKTLTKRFHRNEWQDLETDYY